MNLTEVFLQSAVRQPDQPALLSVQEELSYQGLAQRVCALAGAFEAIGLEASDKLGILLWNTPAFVLAYLAGLSLGVTVIPLNTRLTAAELSTILQDAEAKWLVSCEEFKEVLGELNVPSLQGWILDGVWRPSQPSVHGLDALLAWRKTPSDPWPRLLEANHLAALIYTSGTTGKPKGVMLSHQNLLADAQANAQVIEATQEDRFITISPLFHVFGQVNILLTALLTGASIVLVRRFNPKSVLEAIEQHQVTFMAAVPTMYQMMLAHLKERSYNLSSLRVCHSGAAPMAKETFRQVETVFGAPVQEGYGLSEASSIVTSNPLRGTRKPGSVGLPLTGLRLQVLDEAMGPVPAGEIGEVHVQGPTVMLGYYQRPQETEKALVNGWLKTKDMGYLDEEGYLHIVDRRDDLINIGGVKVYPREVEEVLYRHPDIQSVAVVGIASTLYHEEIKAFIVLQEGCDPSKIEIQKFCREHLAEYKIPKHLEFVDIIPQGATGKILRKELRS